MYISSNKTYSIYIYNFRILYLFRIIKFKSFFNSAACLTRNSCLAACLLANANELIHL